MKEKILRATAQIISKRGLNAASTRAICEAVGITAPTLYHYFNDKDDLLKAVISFAFDLHMNHLSWNDTDADCRLELQKVWDLYLDFAMTESALYRIMVISVVQGNILEVGYSCFQKLVHLFERARQKNLNDYDSIVAAQIYISAAQGLALTLLSLPEGDIDRSLSLSQKSREFIINELLKA